MNKEILIFPDNVTDKHKFHYPENSIWIDDVHVDKTLVSNNVSFG